MPAKRRTKPIKYYSPKRRAVYECGDEINHFVLFELHGWICYLCKKPINRYLRKPHYMAATVEHIVPISQGGTHTWDNVAASHARCNFDKANMLLDDFSSTIAS